MKKYQIIIAVIVFFLFVGFFVFKKNNVNTQYLNHFETETLSVDFPGFRKDLTKPSGKYYFENNTGTIGVYIESFFIDTNSTDSEILEEMLKTEKEINDILGKNSDFQIINQSISYDVNPQIMIIDQYDEKNFYRIVSKVLVNSGNVVRCAVHDYLVKDIETSDKNIQRIIDSCSIK